MTVAYYQPPALGADDAHGTYWINVTDPVVSRYEAETVAFHEAVPGHHTQFALQAELDLPRFRQIGTLLSGYQEGWGLYTERLCDEMGLYSGDLARIGMLAMDSLREVSPGDRHRRPPPRLVAAAGARPHARQRAGQRSVRRGRGQPLLGLPRPGVRLHDRPPRDRTPAHDSAAATGQPVRHSTVPRRRPWPGSVPLTTLAANVERWIARSHR